MTEVQSDMPRPRPALLRHGAATASAALAMVVLTGAAPAPAPAAAPLAPVQTVGPHFGTPGAPYDISADNQELFQQERRLVYTGSVEVIQGTSRLRTPQLTILYAPKPGTPGAPAAAPGAGGGTGFGAIQHMEATGPVYLVTPTQSAKGDHGTFDTASDTIVLTGNVTLLQDKNVATGDKLVIEQKTGHSVLSMNTPGPRVRGVFYSQQAAATAPATGAPVTTPAPAPAKPVKPVRP